MSMSTVTLQTLPSPKPSRLLRNSAAPSRLSVLGFRFRRRAVLTELRLARPATARGFSGGFSGKSPELLYERSARVYAGDQENVDPGGDHGNGEREFREESTMPPRFRHLLKEVPEPPLRWPWLVAAGFLVYAWRAVLFELRNWKLASQAIVGFTGKLLKLVLALILELIGSPITSVIYGLETGWYSVRAFYSGMIAYTPVPEFTTIIVLSCAVLAIAEATVPDSVSSQPWALTIAGATAYAAVISRISELFFWTVLVSLYGYQRLARKRDHVSSALPVAAVLAAVGDTWVRVLAIFAYSALAVFQHSIRSPEEKERAAAVTERKPPLPLLLVGLAIGTRLAANWAGYRHLTWMIV